MSAWWKSSDLKICEDRTETPRKARRGSSAGVQEHGMTAKGSMATREIRDEAAEKKSRSKGRDRLNNVQAREARLPNPSIETCSLRQEPPVETNEIGVEASGKS
jgi:hypothetical protein